MTKVGYHSIVSMEPLRGHTSHEGLGFIGSGLYGIVHMRKRFL